MIFLQTPDYTWSCDPRQGGFSLRPAQAALPAIDNARMRVKFRQGGVRLTLLDGSWDVRGVELAQRDSRHGVLDQCELRLKPHSSGLTCRLIFALSRAYPMLLWKVILQNNGSAPLTLERIEMLRAETTAGQLRLGVQDDPAAWTFYANGWQSWSNTCTYGPNDRQRRSRVGGLQNPMVLNPGTPLPGKRGVFGSDFFGALLDARQNTALIAGFLSQREQFGSLEAVLRGRPSLALWANGDDVQLNPGAGLQTDWAALFCLPLGDSETLAPYLDAVARENLVPGPGKAPVGWCSWYHYYEKVTADDIRQNIKALQSQRETLPVQLVQIDDGFETIAGDWFDFKPTFPKGVASLAAEIRSADMTPGLWLAPFIVHPQSRLMREHPDWILRTRSGRPVNAGFVWRALCTALDLSEPAALAYACRVVEAAVRDWGFPYLKLDFLYAAALKGVYRDPTRTRAQVLYQGMQALRETVGENTLLLGCGLPLGAGLGVVDAMRISCDVDGSWHPRMLGLRFLFHPEPHFPAARNAVNNILTRAPLHGRWWVNDPDCLLVRPNTDLTLAEVQTLATAIALTGGSLLLSDDLTRLPEERRALAEALLPVIETRARVIDWAVPGTPQHLRVDLFGALGGWNLLAWFNLADTPAPASLSPADFGLPAGRVWLRSFWDGQTWLLDAGQRLEGVTVPAHGVLLLAARPVTDGRAQYLGSDLHIAQGLEVSGWREQDGELTVDFRLPRTARGTVELALPGEPRSAELDGQPVEWQPAGEGRWRFAVQFKREGRMVVRW